MAIAIAKRSYHGDPHCGDAAMHWQNDGKLILCICDGLGHGAAAEEAAEAALEYVGKHLADPLEDVFSGCNLALRFTRGVAMGIAIIEEGKETLIYAGIGNTQAIILRQGNSCAPGKPTVRPTSDHGIVGGGYRKLSVEEVPFSSGDLLVLCTDGLKSAFTPTAYEDALSVAPRRLAERILRDWARETDDASVLVFRQ